MAAKKTAKRTTRPQKEFSIEEMVEFVHSIPDIQEAFTRADVELALDDRGWTNYSNSGVRSFVELDSASRAIYISRSRMYWLRDPLAKQAVRLWTDYSLGNGFTYKSVTEAKKAEASSTRPKKKAAPSEAAPSEAAPSGSGSPADADAIREKLDKFCRYRKNKKVMGSEGQRKSSKKLLIDGDVFFALFEDEKAGRIIRRIDPLQITDIMSDPDDEETVLCYRRQMSNNKVVYYRDWAVTDDEEEALASLTDPHTKKQITVEEGVVVYHVPFDSLHKRGNGLLFCASDWSREHRKFMEARVAIVAALARFAWKGEVKGGQSMVNSIKRQLESTYAQVGPTLPERNPSNSPGGTWLQNQGISLDAMPRATGAGDAKEDGNGLKLMVAAATGIMLHYFGDPSTGNLATATAMELPMLKMFESYQQLWTDVWRDIFSIVLEEDPDELPNYIDIDYPPILAEDLQKLAAFLTSVTTVFPEAKVPDLLQKMLQALGINNLDELMETIAAKREELDAQQEELQAAMGSLPPIPGGPAGGRQTSGSANGNAQKQQEAIEAYTNLAEAFRELASHLR